jgi:predicted deacetylase
MRPKVNISIDDVSPHPMSSIKVVDRCFELIEEFEDIKFTLFVPAAYWRTQGETATKDPLILRNFPDFCDSLRKLPIENFELGYHGVLHGIPNISNNDELRDVSLIEARQIFKVMLTAVEEAGLKDLFKPILRPPAWRMPPEAFTAASECGIKIFALSPKDYATEIYAGADKQYDTVYYNVNPPFDPLKIFDKTEMVYHACEWDKNYLDKQKTEELIEFLKNKEVDFCFMKEML